MSKPLGKPAAPPAKGGKPTRGKGKGEKEEVKDDEHQAELEREALEPSFYNAFVRSC